MAEPVRPLPAPDALTAPFWAAARAGRLAIQRCAGCGRFAHPPVAVCPVCASAELGWEDVSGRGAVHARVVVHVALVEGFAAAVPFVGLAVELDEQPGLILLANGEDAAVGERVRAVFEQVDDEVVLPQFVPDRA